MIPSEIIEPPYLNIGIKANKDSSILIHKENHVGHTKAIKIAKMLTNKAKKNEGINLATRKGIIFHFPSHSWMFYLNYLSYQAMKANSLSVNIPINVINPWNLKLWKFAVGGFT